MSEMMNEGRPKDVRTYPMGIHSLLGKTDAELRPDGGMQRDGGIADEDGDDE